MPTSTTTRVRLVTTKGLRELLATWVETPELGRGIAYNRLPRTITRSTHVSLPREGQELYEADPTSLVAAIPLMGSHGPRTVTGHYMTFVLRDEAADLWMVRT